jgi:hypothetical protein
MGILDGRTRIEVSAPVLNSPRLPAGMAGFRIALVTDLHFGRYGREPYARRVFELVRGGKPDLVIFGGDVIDYSHDWALRLAPLLSELGRDLRCLAVVGNHEYYTGIHTMLELFRRCNIEVLLNRHVLVGRGGDIRQGGAGNPGGAIAIAGLDDLAQGRPDMRAALGGIDPQTFTIVVSHCPDLADSIAPGQPADLVLAGHTHGGQICLFGRALATETRNARYVRGRVAGPRCPVYISRGLGLTGFPLRLGSDPELPIITLER